ncbi:Uncharacterised protein [Bordetella pertussis]|nr:Uncharacterised protein [Bordetella pertussis]
MSSSTGVPCIVIEFLMTKTGSPGCSASFCATSSVADAWEKPWVDTSGTSTTPSRRSMCQNELSMRLVS